jgi:hypothetical protein
MVVLDRHPGSASRVHSALTSPAGSNIWSSAATTPSRVALSLVTQIVNEASVRPESHHVKPLLLMLTRNSSKVLPLKMPTPKSISKVVPVSFQLGKKLKRSLQTAELGKKLEAEAPT